MCKSIILNRWKGIKNVECSFYFIRETCNHHWLPSKLSKLYFTTQKTKCLSFEKHHLMSRPSKYISPCFLFWHLKLDGRNYHEQPSFCVVAYILVSIYVMKKNSYYLLWPKYLMTEIFDNRNIWWQKFSLQSMAGDSDMNNPQKVECKLKVKAKVRETKALPKAN